MCVRMTSLQSGRFPRLGKMTVAVAAIAALLAVFAAQSEAVDYELTVQATDTLGNPWTVAITGTPAGTTPYSETVGSLDLTAPADTDRYFIRWKDDVGNTLSDHMHYTQATLTSDTTVIAEYSSTVTEFYLNDGTAETGNEAGDDTENSGTSPYSPMATLTAMLQRYDLGYGATIHMEPGTYNDAVYVVSSNSGLTIDGAGPGQTIWDGYDSICVSVLSADDVTFSNLTFTGGQSGAYTEYSTATFRNCIFTGIHPSVLGGAVCCCGGSETIENCTITQNWPLEGGAGYALLLFYETVTLKNSILYFNAMPQFYNTMGTLTIVRCDIEGYGGSQTAFDADPLFASTTDFHLESETGRWDPSTSAWVTDEVTSRCVDGGDAASSYSNEPAPNGGRINIGAYGNTPEASKHLKGDANEDCDVNILDLIFINGRMNQDVNSGDNWKADVNRDDLIDMNDLYFVRNVLNTTCP